MSPVAFNVFRTIQNSFKLNGPILSYELNLTNQEQTTTGFVTFVGIVTATYTGPDIPEGDFSFQWYLNDTPVQDTSLNAGSSAKIVSIGASSSLTIPDVVYNKPNQNVYVIADYLPAANEGNADNDELKSDTADLISTPEITISSQSDDVTLATGIGATFSVVASSESGNTLNYQWQFCRQSDGQFFDLIDNGRYLNGMATLPGSATLNVQSDQGENFNLSFEDIISYSKFVTGRTYTLTSDIDFATKIYATGGGGGESNQRNVSGGSGGAAQGDFTFLAGQPYKLRIGTAGTKGGAGGFPGGGAGGSGNGLGGGGGGYTGLFIDSISQANTILLAGGGGGGSNSPGTGGNSGQVGSDGTGTGAGAGGTQSAGGSGSGTGSDGSALAGGAGAAGGGAGYFGGGGGNASSGLDDGAGGGGSSFVHPTLVTNGSFDRENTNIEKLNYGENGSFRIQRVTPEVQALVVASNVFTPNLLITSSTADRGILVRCKVTDPSENAVPVYSIPVTYDAITPRRVLQFESFTTTNLFKNQKVDLDDENVDEFILSSSTFGADYSVIQFHSPESNYELRLEMEASRGSNTTGFSGGEGGKSIIDINLLQNEEYTLIGVSNNSGLFLYRGSTLIAAVGTGGDAGIGGAGGNGGGVNNSGTNGTGLDGGLGGVSPAAGTLTQTGIFGSVMVGTGVSLYPGDTIAAAPDGGKTINCTRGSYWISQGISPCSQNSTELIRYRSFDGTEIGQSSLLNRGFKAGYTVTNTAGDGQSLGGNGGTGAVGGQGGLSNSGGGGAAGYNDGSIEIISSSSGGNTSTNSTVTFSIPTNTITVSWTVTRETFNANSITFEKISGIGPDTITWGPNAGVLQTEIASGAVYELLSTTGTLRLVGNTLQLEDGVDNDFDDLQVTPSSGTFVTSTRFEL